MSGLPFPKQSKSVYEKFLTSKHLLQNLRMYDLAAGNVDPIKIASLRDKHGDDGRAMGVLIKGETNKVTETEPLSGDTLQRNKLKRKRKNREKFVSKKQKSSSFESDKDSSSQTKPVQLVANYHSDSEDDDHHLLEIPEAIKNLYNSDHEEGKEQDSIVHQPSFDSDSDPEYLGYFEVSESETEEDKQDNFISLRNTTKDDRKKPSLVLSTYTCEKCGKIGHLSKHCTVGKQNLKMSSQLKRLFAMCRDIRSCSEKVSCAACGVHSNLVHCLDCKSVFCDGRGHISHHLHTHLLHKTLYSYKLDKLIKCCNPECSTVDIYKLLMCSFCLSKAFSQHYSMITATWSSKGLKTILNALCCDEHFQWHRMNCTNTAEEYLVTESKLAQLSQSSSGMLSEFFF